jgi:hypothetical protein
MPAGNTAAQQHEAEDAEFHLDYEDDDADDVQDEADIVAAGKGSSRQRGCASDRLKAVFQQKTLEQTYAAFGIILAPDMSPGQR